MIMPSLETTNSHAIIHSVRSNKWMGHASNTNTRFNEISSVTQNRLICLLAEYTQTVHYDKLIIPPLSKQQWGTCTMKPSRQKDDNNTLLCTCTCTLTKHHNTSCRPGIGGYTEEV